ncbi:MAG: Phosphoribosylaminoimidazolesuccinocarboxamide synthase [Bacteroidetes bacterium]|nr:Phosphoribosylaminoimidazolesuccinocarboxamide synthase [Bacteroidota bacterium]
MARALRVGGTAKNLFEAEQAGMLIQQFKDTLHSRGGADESGPRQNSGQDPTKVATTERPAKGQNATIATLANEISSYLFNYLAGFRIPTHFSAKVSKSEMLVKELTMIPLDVHVHNVASGEFSKRFGMKEGTELTVPIIEHYYKNPDLGNPLTNEFHIYSLGLATPEQLRAINRIASKTNVVLKSFFERRDLKLLSMSLEFGASGTQIMIGDEISPRNCRFADLQKKDHGARDIFSNGVDALESYTEVRNRIYRTF